MMSEVEAFNEKDTDAIHRVIRPHEEKTKFLQDATLSTQADMGTELVVKI